MIVAKNVLRCFFPVLVLALVFTLKCAAGSADGKNSVRSSASDGLNAILASVNGEPISLGDILPLTRNKEYQAYAAYSGRRLFEAIRELRKQAVDEVIDNRLIIADYQRQNIRIPEREIEAEIDRLAIRMNCRSRSEFYRKLLENNMSYQEVRRRVADNMIVQFMLYRRVAIAGQRPTPRQLYDYFMANAVALAGVERVELAMLKLDENVPGYADKCKEISARLKADPGCFVQLVKFYTPASGDGRLGELERTKLRPEFAAALKGDLRPGQLAGPIKIDDGTVWLRVIAHHKPQKITFSDVEQRIADILEQKQRNEVRQQYSRELRSNALIEYFF